MSATVEISSELERRCHEALTQINDPCSVRNRTPLSLIEMGIVERIDVDEAGQATITMLLTDPSCVFFFEIGREIEACCGAIEGIVSVEVKSIGDRWWEPERMSDAARQRLEAMRTRRDRGTRDVRIGRPVAGGTSAP